MLVPVTCGCGKTFRVKEERIGHTGKCPECGLVIRVPFPTNEPWAGPVPELAGLWQENSVGDGVLPADLIDTSRPSVANPKTPLSSDSIPDVEDAIKAIMPSISPVSSTAPKVAPRVPADVPAKDPAHRVIITGVEIGFEDLLISDD